MNRTAKLLLVAPGGGCGGTGTCSVTATGNTAVYARFSVLGLRGLS